MIACNDYILLEACIYSILRKHFRSHAAYGNLMELFHEVFNRMPCCALINECYIGMEWASRRLVLVSPARAAVLVPLRCPAIATAPPRPIRTNLPIRAHAH